MFTDELNSIKTKSEIIEEVKSNIEEWKQEIFEDVAKDCIEVIKNNIKNKVAEERYEIRSKIRYIKDSIGKKTFEKRFLVSFSKWVDREETVNSAELTDNLIDELYFDSVPHYMIIGLKFLERNIKVVKYGFLGLKRKAYVNFINKSRVRYFFDIIKEGAMKDGINIDKCYFKISYGNKLTAFVDLDNNEIPYSRSMKANGYYLSYTLCIDYSISF